MMSLPKFLAVSLGLNACALAAIVFLVQTQPKPVETVRVLRLPTNSPIIQTGSNKPGTQRQRRVNVDPFNWSSVEAEDYVTYIANLRSIGCPEETIKDIIVADVTKLYAQRRAELADAEEPFKFWQTDEQRQHAVDSQKDQPRRELEKERRALLRQLLGQDIEMNPREEAQRLTYLPADKRASVANILARYRGLEEELHLEGTEYLASEEGRAHLNQLRDRQRAELAQTLTPKELEDYDLRNSDLARQMRHDLVGFTPSEAEFRAIYRMRQQLTREPIEGAAQRGQSKTQMEAGLKTLLGEERYADYQRAGDRGFRELTEIAQRQTLPRQTAVTAYDMQRLAEQQALEVSGDSKLTEEQRNAALEAIREETVKSLKTALGEKTYAAYFPDGVAWVAADEITAAPAAAMTNLPPVPPMPPEASPTQSRTNRTANRVLTVYGLGTGADGSSGPRRYLIRRRIPASTPESPP